MTLRHRLLKWADSPSGANLDMLLYGAMTWCLAIPFIVLAQWLIRRTCK